MELFNTLLKGSWKDKNGNVLTFMEDKENEKGLIMLIDGGDCSEGMEEKVDCDLEDIKKAVLWYGYTELFDNLSKTLKK